MLTTPTIEKLNSMRLYGMAKALTEQLQQPDINSLSFDERFALLVDHEYLDKENRRLSSRLRKAKLKQSACMEDIDYHKSRGLDKSFCMQLASCNWIKKHLNIFAIGPTGCGKTYLACALAHKACLCGFSAYYARLPKLLPLLSIAKGDGTYIKIINSLEKTDLLVLDDWGLIKMNAEHRRDILEILDDRYDRKSTIITSQLPVNLWHESIDDNTLADAILDRIVHNAYRIELKGTESMRKMKSKLTTGGES
jgi:DNA replication protein DnaC